MLGTVLGDVVEGFFFKFAIASSPAPVLQRPGVGFVRLQKALEKNLEKHLIVVNCNKLSRTHPCPAPPSSESQDLNNEVEFSTPVVWMLFHSMFPVARSGFSWSVGRVSLGAEQQCWGCAGHSLPLSGSPPPPPLHLCCLECLCRCIEIRQNQFACPSCSRVVQMCLCGYQEGHSTGTEMNSRGRNN